MRQCVATTHHLPFTNPASLGRRAGPPRPRLPTRRNRSARPPPALGQQPPQVESREQQHTCAKTKHVVQGPGARRRTARPWIRGLRRLARRLANGRTRLSRRPRAHLAHPPPHLCPLQHEEHALCLDRKQNRIFSTFSLPPSLSPSIPLPLDTLLIHHLCLPVSHLLPHHPPQRHTSRARARPPCALPARHHAHARAAPRD